MNYLQLINRLRVECGVSGAATPLTSVTGLTGESYRLSQWINSAWVDVQTAKNDWQWMRQPVEFTLTTQQQFYTAVEAGLTDFANWKRDSFRVSSVGQDYKDEQLTNYMDYTTFRNLYMYGNMRTTYARPVVVSIDPDKKLGFGSIPDRSYVVTGEYYYAPVEFTAATDTPPDVFPNRYHMMIVYRAMMFYGGYESAPEVYQRGETEFKRLMNLVDIDQLPTLISGPPLA